MSGTFARNLGALYRKFTNTSDSVRLVVYALFLCLCFWSVMIFLEYRSSSNYTPTPVKTWEDHMDEELEAEIRAEKEEREYNNSRNVRKFLMQQEMNDR